MKNEAAYCDYLRSSLPMADIMAMEEKDIVNIVRHALTVRNAVPWGNTIPEEIFRAFVLFPRINNEDPVFYQGIIWSSLKDRLAGLSMAEAIREVNYWCCEHATYQSTDGRTANPLTVMCRGYGRCGEESTLLVAALRSCGIPARQVYVPRWSHCDDNHAWVEAWADGVWHYMGACEPEIVLDSGWFTSAASKAMLVHTTSYGVDITSQRTESTSGKAVEINCTPTYADTRLLHVAVTENFQPLPGITVEFQLVNSAELFPISTKITDDSGCVSLLAGLGFLLLHVTDGHRYIDVPVQCDITDHVEIDFACAVEFSTKTVLISQYPPKETKIQPSVFTPEETELHQKRMEKCEESRRQHEATFSAASPVLASSRGNHREIELFLADTSFSMEDKQLLLTSLHEKDLVDSTCALLMDAIVSAMPFRSRYPEKVWQESVLCPRVAVEKLYPDRMWLRAHCGSFSSAMDVWNMLQSTISVEEMSPRNLIPPMRSIVNCKKASPIMLDILFVNICRVNGIACRLNPATHEKEIWQNGSYAALFPKRRADAALRLTSSLGRALVYGVDFSLSRLEGGRWHTLGLYGKTMDGEMEIDVMPGFYRAVCCTRQMNGAVDACLLPVQVEKNSPAEIPLTFPTERTRELLVGAQLPPLRVEGADGSSTFLPIPDYNSIVALIAPGQEPTEHFLNELLENKEQLSAHVQLIIHHRADSANPKLQSVLREIPTAQLFLEPESHVLEQWRRLMNAGELRLPLAVAVDDKGKGQFAFTNYHVGSVSSLLRVLGQK